jgi:hypothetical protein
VSWTDNSSNENGFKVYRATDSSFTQNVTLLTTTAANVTSYQDAGLSAGTTYYYRVSATDSAGDSAFSNTASATTSGGGSQTTVDLSSAYNRTGIVADGSTFGGGLDGGGYALSANLTGSTLAVGGSTFNLGPAGSADVVSAAGQSVALPAGRYSSLKLLATAVNGAQAYQAFTVTYADGTTATLTQSLSDWAVPQGYAGESTALSTPYRDTAWGGRQAATVRVYEYAMALDPTRTVATISLPRNANVEVFAIDVTP